MVVVVTIRNYQMLCFRIVVTVTVVVRFRIIRFIEVTVTVTVVRLIQISTIFVALPARRSGAEYLRPRGLSGTERVHNSSKSQA